MLLSEMAGTDDSGSVVDGVDGGRSSTSSSPVCSVGEVIFALVVLQRLHSPYGWRLRNRLINVSAWKS
jgi:hypothetical protein